MDSFLWILKIKTISLIIYFKIIKINNEYHVNNYVRFFLYIYIYDICHKRYNNRFYVWYIYICILKLISVLYCIIMY